MKSNNIGNIYGGQKPDLIQSTLFLFLGQSDHVYRFYCVKLLINLFTNQQDFTEAPTTQFFNWLEILHTKKIFFHFYNRRKCIDFVFIYQKTFRKTKVQILKNQIWIDSSRILNCKNIFSEQKHFLKYFYSLKKEHLLVHIKTKNQ